MDEDPAPKPAEKAERGTSTDNPYKSTKKGAFHTFLGPPTAKAQRAAMRSLNATVPKVHQYVRWSEMPVQWIRDDHPEHIPDGYYAMVVNPLIQVLELCPRGNNKDVIIIILVHDNVYILCWNCIKWKH
jgi:hypothetical protein